MVSFVDLLRAERVAAIIRGTSAEAAVACTSALFGAGIRLVEVSLTTAGALDAIRTLAADLPDGCHVGAGTVVTDADAESAAASGASFVVTPGLTAGARRAVALGLPVAPGVFTPSEVYAALDMGAVAVKLFPASLGGPDYLRALRQPMPDVAFVPVGGVGLDIARAYLDAGAVAVGVGSPLVGDAASGGSLEALATRAREYAALREG